MTSLIFTPHLRDYYTGVSDRISEEDPMTEGQEVKKTPPPPPPEPKVMPSALVAVDNMQKQSTVDLKRRGS